MQKHFAQALMVPNFLILFWLVWTPNTSEYCGSDSLNATNVFCLPLIWSWVGNVMLLMPTALLLFLILNRGRTVKIALFIVVLPLVIEGVQTFIPGRDPDLGDFLMNSLGGLTFLYLLNRFTERVRS
jgi:hypothetical protein